MVRTRSIPSLEPFRLLYVVLQHNLPTHVNLPIYPFGASAILLHTVPAVRYYIQRRRC